MDIGYKQFKWQLKTYLFGVEIWAHCDYLFKMHLPKFSFLLLKVPVFTHTFSLRACKFVASINRVNPRICRSIFLCALIDEVVVWIFSNRLQLNTTKTEILWSSTIRCGHQLLQQPLSVAPATVVCDLGIFINSNVSMRSRSSTSTIEHLSVSVQVYAPVVGVMILSSLDWTT